MRRNIEVLAKSLVSTENCMRTLLEEHLFEMVAGCRISNGDRLECLFQITELVCQLSWGTGKADLLAFQLD